MKKLFAILCVLTISSSAWACLECMGKQTAPFSLPDLSYSYNGLEPHIDEDTMRIHHSLHHQGYINNANQLLKKNKTPVKEILQNISKHETGIRNNVGGHWNHSFFWTVLTSESDKQKMPKRLEKEIKKHFGSVKAFYKAFEEKASSQFGSGWAWLVLTQEGTLEVTSTANQDNPIMDVVDVQGTPIFGIDVWEHAYYLKYQNKRSAYLENIWKIVNWAQVDSYLQEAKKD